MKRVFILSVILVTNAVAVDRNQTREAVSLMQRVARLYTLVSLMPLGEFFAIARMLRKHIDVLSDYFDFKKNVSWAAWISEHWVSLPFLMLFIYINVYQQIEG